MAFEDDLTAATQALNNAAEAYHGKIGDIDARVEAKEAQVDAFLGSAEAGIGLPARIAFDPTVFHSKATLLADGVVADPAANWQTEWRSLKDFSLPSEAFFYVGARRAFAILSRSYSAGSAGATDNPPYSVDYSRSRIDLVLANRDATTVEINDWLLQNPDAPSASIPMMEGNTVYSSEIPVIQIAGKHLYTCAFYRIRNTISGSAITAGQATENSPLQEITTYGGNPFVGLQAIECRSL